MSQNTAVVTGATGYVASWIVRRLLEDGWRVRGSMRDLTAADKRRHLDALSQEFPGRLDLFAADLLSPGAFDEACEGADVVVHTASPFVTGEVERPREALIEPALRGTENVLGAATRSASVRRVVLTSSVVAVHGDADEVKRAPGGAFTEDQWNRSAAEDYQPYGYSKTVAERRAWELAGEASWSLSVMNPGFVLGPSLTPRGDSTSIALMRQMLSGEFADGVPRLVFGVVDVRDVAEAHLVAANAVTRGEEGDGGRHILVGSHASLLEIARTIDRVAPGRYRLPDKEVPKLMFYLIGRKIGFSRRYVRHNVGVAVRYDNSRSRRRLGIAYRSLSETLRDHLEQLERDGLS